MDLQTFYLYLSHEFLDFFVVKLEGVRAGRMRNEDALNGMQVHKVHI